MPVISQKRGFRKFKPSKKAKKNKKKTRKERASHSQPGRSALQWIFSVPYSTAICFVNSTTAPLLAQYAAAPGFNPTRPSKLAVLMIQPRWPEGSWGAWMRNGATAYLQPRKTDLVFTALTIKKIKFREYRDSGQHRSRGPTHPIDRRP